MSLTRFLGQLLLCLILVHPIVSYTQPDLPKPSPTSVEDRSYSFGFCMAMEARMHGLVVTNQIQHWEDFSKGFQARIEALPDTRAKIEAAQRETAAIEHRRVPKFDETRLYGLGANFAKESLGIIPIPAEDFDLVYFSKGVQAVVEMQPPQFNPVAMEQLFVDYQQNLRDQHLQMILNQASNASFKSVVEARSYMFGYKLVEYCNETPAYQRIEHQQDIQQLIANFYEGVQATGSTIQTIDSLTERLSMISKSWVQVTATGLFMNESVDINIPLNDFQKAWLQKGAEAALQQQQPPLPKDDLELFFDYYVKQVQERHDLFIIQQYIQDRSSATAFLKQNAQQEGVVVVGEATQYTIKEIGTGEQLGINDKIDFKRTYRLLDSTVLFAVERKDEAFDNSFLNLLGTNNYEKLQVGAQYTIFLRYDEWEEDPFKWTVTQAQQKRHRENALMAIDVEIVGRNTKQKKIDAARKEARQWLAENAKRKNITTLPSGLQYEVLKEGTGALPTYHAKVLIHADQVTKEGQPMNGIVKRAKSYTIHKDRLFKEALRQLRKGARYRFYFSPDLVANYPKYKQAAPNDVLVVEIELLDLYYKEGTFVNRSKEATKALQRLAQKKTVRTLPNGTLCQVLNVGQGQQHPSPKDWVELHYTAAVKGQAPFASTQQRGTPILYNLNEAPADWKAAIGEMTVGTVYRLELPPAAQKGRLPAAPPEGQTVVYTIELASLVEPRFEAKGAARRWLAARTQQKGVTVMPSGIQYEVLKVGDGQRHPTAQDSVTLHVTGRLISGEAFTSTMDHKQPLRVAVADLPRTFKYIIPHLSVGATYRFVVPEEYTEFMTPGGGQFKPDYDIRSWSGNTYMYDITLLEIDALHTTTKQTIETSQALLAKNAQRKNVTTLPSGLQYTILKEGKGDPVDSIAVIAYQCMLPNGQMLDHRRTAHGNELLVELDQLIPGLKEGIQLMREGATYLFFVPSELAYGNQPQDPRIPAGTALMYEIKLRATNYAWAEREGNKDPYHFYINEKVLNTILVRD